MQEVRSIDAKECSNGEIWLRRLEIFQKQGVKALLIGNYHILLKQSPLMDEIISDWFEVVIGISPHWCRGRAGYFYQIGPSCETKFAVLLPLWWPSKWVPNVTMRYGRFYLVKSRTIGLIPISSSGRRVPVSVMKTLFYCFLFDIFSLNYANKSSRSPA